MLEQRIAAARGAAALGARSIDAKELDDRRRQRRRRPSTSRTRRPASRRSSRSSARPRPTRREQALQRVAGRQARCSATSAATTVAVPVPSGPTRKLKITKIDVGLGSGAMADEPASELLATRRAKLERCAPTGIDPFPHAFPGVDADRRGPRGARRACEPGRRPTRRYRVAGRLHARRGQGKMAFLDLVDRSRAHPAAGARRRARRGARWSGCSTSTSATSSASTASRSAPGAAS